MPDSSAIVSDLSAAAAAHNLSVAAGALPLAVVLDQRTVLLCGWMPVPPPPVAAVVLGDDATCGTWQAMTWGSGEDPAIHQFVAIVRAENIVRAQSLPLLLRPEGGSRPLPLPEIARVELDAAPLLEQLRTIAADLAAVFDFVKDAAGGTLPHGTPAHGTHDGANGPGAVSPRIRDFLLAFLGAISVQDGFVEIVGRPDCKGLLLQGWSVHLEAGTLDFGLLGGGLELHEAGVACFERADLLSTARGLMAFMRTARNIDPQALSRVYFKSQDTYYHLDVVEQRIVLDEEQTTAHLKDMLGRLQGPLAAVRALKRVCRPRFPGHETVSALTTPVRLAQDVVLHAPGGGIFVSGWLLDPRKTVWMVLLKSTRNFYARIDQTWVRLPRPDVTQGFSSDPLFAESLRPWDNQHGFIAFVPRPQPIAADEVHYLEVVFEDETCTFLPVKFSDGDPQAMLQQILGGVNVDDPAIERIVSTHLGPLASALCAGIHKIPSVSANGFGCPVDAPRVSVVMPLSAGWNDFDINLARLAADPDFRDAELVVVAPREGGDRVAHALRRYAPFYGIGGTLVLTDEPLDHHSALDAGARAARAGLLLFLSPSVFPRERGWLKQLVQALADAPNAGAASPTLLYEDDSLRYAGTDEAAEADQGVIADRFRGYGHHWLDGREAQPVSAGSAECCIVRAEVYAALGGFSQEFVCSDLRSRDFGLRLKAAGSTFYWLPSLRMYALDDPSSELQDYWMRVRRLVDRWSFARKWSAAAPTGAQAPAATVQK